MDPNDCDGEPNARPISASAAMVLIPAAMALIPAAEVLGTGLVLDLDDVIVDPTTGEIPWWAPGGDCGESTPPGPTDRAAKERLQGASRRRYGCPRDQMPYTGPNYLAGWDEEDRRLGPGVIEVPPVRVVDLDDVRTIDDDVLGYLDEIREVVALATVPRRCTLCSVGIPPHALRLVWSWANDNDENLVLHAHRGCDAIRREIDLGEWHEGDLLDRLVQWAQADRLNHDLGELDAGLTADQREDHGGEIIAAAIRAIADDTKCPGCPSCQPVACEGESPVVRFMLGEGACADCGGIVRTIEEARRHEHGYACAERNEVEQEPTITVVWHCDGFGNLDTPTPR